MRLLPVVTLHTPKNAGRKFTCNFWQIGRPRHCCPLMVVYRRATCGISAGLPTCHLSVDALGFVSKKQWLDVWAETAAASDGYVHRISLWGWQWGKPFQTHAQISQGGLKSRLGYCSTIRTVRILKYRHEGGTGAGA